MHSLTNRLSLIPILVILLFSGCSDDQALVRVNLSKYDLLTRDMLTVAVNDGRSVWLFDASDFDENPQYGGAWSTPEVETSNSGTVTVEFVLIDPSGQEISHGSASETLRPDWRWGFTISRKDTDPMLDCFGCFGSESFPILNPAYAFSDSDSVFIVWGGNSISNPVDY